MPTARLKEVASSLSTEYDRAARELDPATQRSAWTLKAAIIAAVSLMVGAVVLVLTIQASAEDRCDEIREQLEGQWALVMTQLNDRLDDQATELTRCRTSSEALEEDVRNLQKLLLPDDS